MMFLDADDDIAPDMIAKMVQTIKKQHSDMVVCGIKFITFRDGQAVSAVDIGVAPPPAKSDDEDQTTYLVKLLGVDGRLYNPSNKIFRAELIKKHRVRFQIGLDFGEDLTFNLHYLRHAGKVDFIPEPLYIYNFNAATGTFGQSSLVYENRRKNYQELAKFTGQKPSAALRDYLGWIKYFWFYSFALAVCLSRLKFRAKLKLLKQAARAETFQPAKTAVHIGRKKILVERFLGATSHSATALWLFMSLSGFMKNNRLLAGLWRWLAVSLTPKK